MIIFMSKARLVTVLTVDWRLIMTMAVGMACSIVRTVVLDLGLIFVAGLLSRSMWECCSRVCVSVTCCVRLIEIGWLFLLTTALRLLGRVLI